MYPNMKYFENICSCLRGIQKDKSNEKAMNRNRSNQKANSAFKTKMGNNQKSQIDKIQ